MKWINVKDRLPITEKDMGTDNYKAVEVIVFTNDEVCCCEFVAGNSFEFWSEFELENSDITHWMQLPDPPK